MLLSPRAASARGTLSVPPGSCRRSKPTNAHGRCGRPGSRGCRDSSVAQRRGRRGCRHRQPRAHDGGGTMTGSDLDATDPRTLPGFFDALADGELLGGVCADCGQVLLPPRPACYAVAVALSTSNRSPARARCSRTQRSTRRRRPSKRTRPTRSPSWTRGRWPPAWARRRRLRRCHHGDPVELTVREPTATSRKSPLTTRPTGRFSSSYRHYSVFLVRKYTAPRRC